MRIGALKRVASISEPGPGLRLVSRNESNSELDRLEIIHAEIGQCTVCESAVEEFRKPKPLNRGTAGRILVVGEGPGNAELNGGKAFAGQSGRRLEEWLIAAGASEDNPRNGIYFTSVVKCVCSPKYYKTMSRNCSGFLDRQIIAIRPELLITLGRRAFERLHFVEDGFEAALCKPYYTGEVALVTDYGFHFAVLHLPHPSGVNRWHNEPANSTRLTSALKFINKFL